MHLLASRWWRLYALRMYVNVDCFSVTFVLYSIMYNYRSGVYMGKNSSEVDHDVGICSVYVCQCSDCINYLVLPCEDRMRCHVLCA